MVRTTSAAETAEFDELLWTFADRSFVPHCHLAGRPDAVVATPVLVGSSSLPASHRDVLINLAADAPADFSALLVSARWSAADEDAKQAGRQRWRTYRDAGCTPRRIRSDGTPTMNSQPDRRHPGADRHRRPRTRGSASAAINDTSASWAISRRT